MPISAAGNNKRSKPAWARGFTLLELVVVLFIMALSLSLAALALPRNEDRLLQRDAQRLAAMLESARAQSRSSGVAVIWRADERGFHFEGLPVTTGQKHIDWLDADTRALEPRTIVLGPDPLIAAQHITLQGRSNSRAITIGTDGMRPFDLQVQP